MYEELLPKLEDASRCTPRERAALDFADRLAGDHTSIDDAFMRDLHAHFDDADIVELGFVTAAFLMLGRLHRAFGVAAMSAATHTLFAEDGTREAPRLRRGAERGGLGGR